MPKKKFPQLVAGPLRKGLRLSPIEKIRQKINFRPFSFIYSCTHSYSQQKIALRTFCRPETHTMQIQHESSHI